MRCSLPSPHPIGPAKRDNGESPIRFVPASLLAGVRRRSPRRPRYSVIPSQSPRARVLVCGNPRMVIGSAPADNLLIRRAFAKVEIGVPRPKFSDMLNLVDRILQQLQRRPEPPTEVLVQKEANGPSTRRRRSNPSRLRPAPLRVRASRPPLRVNRPRGQQRSS
jgi:hypothetical protein